VLLVKVRHFTQIFR